MVWVYSPCVTNGFMDPTVLLHSVVHGQTIKSCIHDKMPFDCPANRNMSDTDSLKFWSVKLQVGIAYHLNKKHIDVGYEDRGGTPTRDR